MVYVPVKIKSVPEGVAIIDISPLVQSQRAVPMVSGYRIHVSTGILDSDFHCEIADPHPIFRVVMVVGSIEVILFTVMAVSKVFGVPAIGVSGLVVDAMKSGVKLKKGDRFVGVISTLILPEIYLIESSLIILSVVLVGAELAISYDISHAQREPVLVADDPKRFNMRSLDINASPSATGK